jgi:hypothetical protein
MVIFGHEPKRELQKQSRKGRSMVLTNRTTIPSGGEALLDELWEFLGGQKPLIFDVSCPDRTQSLFQKECGRELNKQDLLELMEMIQSNLQTILDYFLHWNFENQPTLPLATTVNGYIGVVLQLTATVDNKIEVVILHPNDPQHDVVGALPIGGEA